MLNWCCTSLTEFLILIISIALCCCSFRSDGRRMWGGRCTATCTKASTLFTIESIHLSDILHEDSLEFEMLARFQYRSIVSSKKLDRFTPILWSGFMCYSRCCCCSCSYNLSIGVHCCCCGWSTTSCIIPSILTIFLLHLYSRTWGRHIIIIISFTFISFRFTFFLFFDVIIIYSSSSSRCRCSRSSCIITTFFSNNIILISLIQWLFTNIMFLIFFIIDFIFLFNFNIDIIILHLIPIRIHKEPCIRINSLIEWSPLILRKLRV